MVASLKQVEKRHYIKTDFKFGNLDWMYSNRIKVQEPLSG